MNLAQVAKQIELESGRYTGGPLQVFELVGRDTFVVLLRHGLLPHHTLLDFGAGCLRLGFWFVRFLDAENYFAIEPSSRMLETGKKYLFCSEILRNKKPHFYVSDRCDMHSFGVAFDYVVARSILTHTKPAMLHKILDEFAKCAAPGAAMLASYWAADGKMAYSIDGPIGDEMARDEWGFIKIVKYTFGYMQGAAAEHGLEVKEVMLDCPRINQQIWLKFSLSVAGRATGETGQPAVATVPDSRSPYRRGDVSLTKRLLRGIRRLTL